MTPSEHLVIAKRNMISNTFVNADISSAVFNTMVKIAAQPHDGYTDIEFLEKSANAEYDELTNAVEIVFLWVQKTSCQQSWSNHRSQLL